MLIFLNDRLEPCGIFRGSLYVVDRAGAGDHQQPFVGAIQYRLDRLSCLIGVFLRRASVMGSSSQISMGGRDGLDGGDA